MDGGRLAQRGARLCHAVVRGEVGTQAVLDFFHADVGSDMASLSVIDPATQQGEVVSRGRPPITGEEHEGWGRLLPRHPYWVHVLTEPAHAPRLTDVVDLRAFTGSEVYTDLLRPWGARYHSVVVLERSPRAVQVLSLWRSHRDFSDAEVAAVAPVGQALAAAATYRGALDRLHAAQEPAADGMTPRQREVVELVALGLTNAQVGTRLGVSPRTVRKHLEALFLLTGARSRTELAVMWREGGGPWPPPPVTGSAR